MIQLEYFIKNYQQARYELVKQILRNYIGSGFDSNFAEKYKDIILDLFGSVERFNEVLSEYLGNAI